MSIPLQKALMDIQADADNDSRHYTDLSHCFTRSPVE